MAVTFCPSCKEPMVDGQQFNGLYGTHRLGCADKARIGDDGSRDAPTKVLDLVLGRIDTKFEELEKLIEEL